MLKRSFYINTNFEFSFFLYIFVKKAMEKVNSYEECPDYLKDMFENYFKYAKYNHFKIPFELLVDAISGGLSGANFPKVNRNELLQSLINNCHLIQEAAKRVLELRQPVTEREAEEAIPAKETRKKYFLNIDEVCELYNLPKSNIKNKEWRESHGLDCIQTCDRGRVTFKTEDVEKWIIQQQKHWFLLFSVYFS